MNTKSIKMNKDFLVLSGFGTLFVCENIISEDKTITLSPGYNSDLNISFKVLFKNGHVKTTNEHMTLNGLPVVVNRYGTLIPIPNHNITGTVYETLQPYTTLEMYYTNNYDGNDNPAFVVVGNPVVLSSADYTIYADGYIDNHTIDVIEYGKMNSITSNAVAKSLSYSTEETLTGGTYIDGKPIYKRTWSFSSFSSTEAIIDSSGTYDKIISQQGFMITDSQIIPVAQNRSADGITLRIPNTSQHNLAYIKTTGVLSADITIEYTKTTD